MEEEIVLRFKADLGSFQAQLKAAQREVNNFTSNIAKGMGSSSSASRKITSEINSMSKSIKRATSDARTFTSSFSSGLKTVDKVLSRTATNFRSLTIGGMHDLLTIQSLFQIKQTAEYVKEAADSYQLMQDRLRLVTSEAVEFKKAQDNLEGSLDGYNQGAINILLTQQKLYKIAQDTRTELETVTSTYTTLARNINDTSISTEDLLDVTEAISKALLISGSSAESANAALVQFGQGMAADALRGQELNSVMEQTPRIAKALADGLKVGLGELRAIAAAGELTAKRTSEALMSQLDVLREETKAIAPTFGQTFTQLGNYLTVTIGQLVQATGMTREFNTEMNVFFGNVKAGSLQLADSPIIRFAAYLKDFWVGLKAALNGAAYLFTTIGDFLFKFIIYPFRELFNYWQKFSSMFGAFTTKGLGSLAEKLGFDEAAKKLKLVSAMFDSVTNNAEKTLDSINKESVKDIKAREAAIAKLRKNMDELYEEMQNTNADSTIKEWQKQYVEYSKQLKALKKEQEEWNKQQQMDLETTNLLFKEYNNLLREASLTDPLDVDKFKAKINEAKALLDRIKKEGRIDITDSGAAPKYDAALLKAQQVEQSYTRKHLDEIKKMYQGTLNDIKQDMQSLRIGDATVESMQQFESTLEQYKEQYLGTLRGMYEEGLLVQSQYEAKKQELLNRTNTITKQEYARMFESYFNMISYLKQQESQLSDERIRNLSANMNEMIAVLRKSGQMTAEEANKIIAKLNKATAGTFSSEWEKTFNETGKALTETFGSDLNETFRRLMDGATDWGDYFKDVIKGVIAQLLDLLVVQKLVNSMMGAFSGGGLGGTTTSSSANVTAFAQGGIVTAPTAFPMTSGIGVMGEDGPEAILPLTRTSDGDLGVKSDSQPLNVNIYNNSNSEVSTRREEDGSLSILIEQVQASIANGIRRGTSPVAGAIQATYGVSR